MTETTNTTPSPTVWHCLSYDDAPAGIDFLTAAFGFVAEAVYHEDDTNTKVMHAQLNWPPGGGIMLGSAPPREGWPDIRGKGSAYCVVESAEAVDALFARATAAGAHVLREPADEDYGGRGFVVLDPEGNQWGFGSYAGE
ncbi:MAG: VOC family protein [Nocardioidaceae bacterium]